jgi:hypothetical protein
MALIQHRDEKIRFQQQADNARAYVLPFIEESFAIDDTCNIMDIVVEMEGYYYLFLKRDARQPG